MSTQPLGMGTPQPRVTDALARYATRGTLFSIQFSNNAQVSPAWSVHRVVRHIREIRVPSIR